MTEISASADWRWWSGSACAWLPLVGTHALWGDALSGGGSAVWWKPRYDTADGDRAGKLPGRRQGRASDDTSEGVELLPLQPLRPCGTGSGLGNLDLENIYDISTTS